MNNSRVLRWATTLLLPLLLNSGVLWAAAGTEGASFLDIPVGARPAALGSAYTAMARDAYAPIYNPAGLAFAASPEIAAQHLIYLQSVHYESLGLAVPFRQGGLGAAVQYLGSGDIPGRALDGSVTSDYSAYYAAYSLAYGHRFGEKIAAGVTAKAIQAKLSDFSASAFSGDFGVMAMPEKRWTVAAVLGNMGTSLKFIDQQDSLPLAARVASAFRPNPISEFMVEGIWRKSGPASAHVGAEIRPWKALSLRAGYRTDTIKELGPLAGLTAGLGIHAWGQELAYAFVPYGDLGATHYISLHLRFGPKVDGHGNLMQVTPKQQASAKPHLESGKEDPESAQLGQILELGETPERAAKKP